jgi:hypothetical protein
MIGVKFGDSQFRVRGEIEKPARLNLATTGFK